MIAFIVIRIAFSLCLLVHSIAFYSKRSCFKRLSFHPLTILHLTNRNPSSRLRKFDLINVRSRSLKMLSSIRTLLVDNYDSYTYNLWQMLSMSNKEDPIVAFSDKYTILSQIQEKFGEFDNIVISPGPGRPDDPRYYSLFKDIFMNAKVPVLGVCLGHQALGSVFGSKVVRSKYPVHGQTSRISHIGKHIFDGIPQGIDVVRYHSLSIDPTSLSSELEATAWAQDGTLMGIKHSNKPLFGVQFHPESICTMHGVKFLENFKNITESYRKGQKKYFASNILSTLESSVELDNSKKIRNVNVIKLKYPTNINLFNIYKNLFGNSSGSFWLDSSGSQKNTQGSCISSNDSFISIMGSLSLPDDYSVEYLSRNEIVERYGWHRFEPSDKESSLKVSNQNIFEFIDNILTNENDVSTAFTYQDENCNEIPACSFDSELDFNPKMFGYIGYEARAAATFILNSPLSESRFNFSATKDETKFSYTKCNSTSQPLAMFMFPSRYIVFDHKENMVYIVSHNTVRTNISSKYEAENKSKFFGRDLLKQLKDVLSSKESCLQNLQSGISLEDGMRCLVASKTKKQYLESINKSMESILAGDSYEICLTLQFEGELPISESLQTYCRLRQNNPAPFSSYFRYNPHGVNAHSDKFTRGNDLRFDWAGQNGFAILSSSPERYLKVTKDGWIETKPIKGTIKRDLLNRETDRKLARELEFDVKSKAENLMIVDLMRNDLGRVCRVGSVEVPNLMSIETYASVHQLVSTVKGHLKSRLNVADALISTFPGGSMTGAPKIRTMEIIDSIEGRSRGIYSGSIGYISMSGQADMNIAIRTAVLSNNTITVGSGGAIVILSDPQKELEEVALKGQAVGNAMGFSVSFPDDA